MVSNMGLFLVFLLSVTLLASPIDGRKGPEKYWIEIMKGHPMPEAIKVYVNGGSNEVSEKRNAFKDNSDDFDTTPNVTIYHDDADSLEVSKNKEDCNSQHDGISSKKLAVNNFKPRPSISTYND
ncbi:uncharacterized protein LOC104890996 [Beta vulgaris subsp. vulgaris]|uniref:uncharacterized protein LOC104890996 n=1 Tax=Beta vulgaris subsp. vulgaris TaxID=3555 RepID=UPI0020367555|nr:uncharacterized protein LOC104890996 [Beta vulgaris subsp. vulgaris]